MNINNINWDMIPTPCYIVDEKKLIGNLEILKSVQDKTGCKILLAQKAFSMFYFYPLIKKYLAGTTASGLFEAKLASEEMGGDSEVHIFSPAYTYAEFDEIMQICDCVVFNSFEQWHKFKPAIQASKKISCGLRVNPEYSEIETELYNPCSKNSRFGETADKFSGIAPESLDGISGLHFHTMCEQNSDVLWRTLMVFDEKFGEYLKDTHMEWVNFGGGHHITREDYDIETLIKSIRFIKDKYNVQVYLEPGEAVALNTGFLISEVVEIVAKNEIDIAILDTSAACHMPDVLEMPYRPEVIGTGRHGEKRHDYLLGGATCLAGDIIGGYSFDTPLCIGDKLVFCDMAHYTMVKNNTFNGMKLPSIAVNTVDGEIKIIKDFGYEDFKMRLS